MIKTVYISYTGSNGAPADAHSIRLSSVDETFGVKRIDTGEVIVPDDQEVDNPSTGYYEYNLNVESGVAYAVSWEIIASSGDTPVYRVDQIGPFETGGIVRVRPDSRGTFAQGSWGAVYIKVYDLNGSPRNADTITVTIKQKDSSTVMVTETPVKVGQGIYVFDWPVPSDAPIGAYLAVWTYVIAGNTYTEVQEINIADDASGNAGHSGVLSLFRIEFERRLPRLQAIPIYTLVANESEDLKTYTFPFSRWNQSAGVKVYRANRLVKGGYEVDYLNGRITFSSKQTEYDEIKASFNFRWFSDEDIDSFLQHGLQMFNSFTPHTSYPFAYIPDKWVPAMMNGAIIEALRVYMGALIQPEARILYETNEQADKAFDYYERIKKDYEEQWKALVDEKRKFPYAGLTRLVIQPAYTMPGGRARLSRMLFGSGF